MNPITETWFINQRINLYLLNAIPEEHLTDQLISKGRNVGEQFAHIHNVRLMWLKSADPSTAKQIEKLEKGNITTAALIASLETSSTAVGKMLDDGLQTGKIKGFKPHPTAFLGYLIAHEAHHRSQIIVALKQSGFKLDQKILYGIWEWGSR